MFAGIDLGTTYTKTHKGIVFPSGISENICLSSNVMSIGDKQFACELFNEKADYEININKGLNKNTKLNFIYALHKNTEEAECHFDNVIVALPCSQWKNSNTVEKYKQYLDLSTAIKVSVNGVEKIIQVESIDVVPEDSTAYYTQQMNYPRFDGRDVLLLGWGSLTINQILFRNDEPIDMFTDEYGVLKIYKDMAEKITSETGYNVKMEDMQSIIQYGLSNRGITVDVSDLIRPIAIEHCRKIYRNLKLKWSIDTIPFVPMVGGGAIGMGKYLKEFIPHIEIMPDAQILSAIGMGEMAGIRL
jgi:hypothetical protein